MHMDKAIRKQKHKIPFNSIIYLMACPIDFDATRFKMDSRREGAQERELEWGAANVCVFFSLEKRRQQQKTSDKTKKSHANTM